MIPAGHLLYISSLLLLAVGALLYWGASHARGMLFIVLLGTASVSIVGAVLACYGASHLRLYARFVGRLHGSLGRGECDRVSPWATPSRPLRGERNHTHVTHDFQLLPVYARCGCSTHRRCACFCVCCACMHVMHVCFCMFVSMCVCMCVYLIVYRTTGDSLPVSCVTLRVYVPSDVLSV